MKVLLETSPLRNAHSIRGVGVYTRYLSKALEQLQTPDLQFITSQDTPLDQLNAFMDKNAVDIIHYPYFDLFKQTLPLPFIQRLTGRAHQKIVVTIHDVIPLVFPDKYPAGLKGTVGLMIQRWLLQSTAAVITDSKTSKNDIVKYLGYPSEKIHVTPLAGNPEIKKTSKAAVISVKKTFQLPEVFLLYVGDINYNKNIPQLIKMMEFLDSSIELVCVGANFKPQPIPEWQAIQEVLGKNKHRVHFLTTIEKGDTQTLSALYTGAAVYIQPSLYEGFGLPLLEAIACETLVVSSNTPALKEIEAAGIEFANPTAMDLSKAVHKVLSESQSQKNERIRQNSGALSRYSWEKTAQQTIGVYTTVA